MKDPRLASHLIRFESFEVNLRSRELLQGGKKIKLPEQSFQILAMLLEHPGEIVMRAEIQKRLWPNDTVVEFENSIHAAVRRLRLALSDPAEAPRYIETLARRGYRWKLPIEVTGVSLDSPLAEALEGARSQGESSALQPIDKRVSHYRVLQVLGGGGMGIVYAAEDLKLGRRVALKFLPEELGHDVAAMERFHREARAASALNHPNICTIHGVEEHQGQPFMIMEMLEGQTLRELISARERQNASDGEGPLQLQTVLDISLQIAEGLDAAHKKGIVHRDIKPANVFITATGRAKILDFGLAKRQESDSSGLVSSTEPRSGQTANLNLTRTGATMGTVGYMSPEQIRGEKVDCRTDLFSFGLVLYEMAVGQRAFTGETAPILHDAILHQTPVAVRELNPRVPAKLQGIIEKALQKDREARYQAAAEVRRDLETLKCETQPRHSMRRIAAVSVVLILLITGVFVSLARRDSETRPEIKLRQLTANSAENHVISGAISSDGKFLAYSDGKGLHVKLIDTGETHDMPPQETLEGRQVEWECVGWFPDGTRILVNAHPSGIGPDWYSPGTSIWIFWVLSGRARMLRDNAAAYSVSPDGSLISFGTNKDRFGDRKIWLMSAAGDQAWKLYEADENSAIGQNSWSPDGERILYPQIDESGVTLISRDLKGGPPLTVRTASEMEGTNSFLWLPDGRLVSAVGEAGAIASTLNLWALRLDERGKPIGKPWRLTNSTGFGMGPTSATKDGRRLAFLQWAFHTTVYVADLREAESRIGNARHFTLTESQDIAADWTQDSKEIILLSNRTGRSGIYKQSPDRDTPELLLEQPSDIAQPRATPDGKWIVYVLYKPPGEATRLPELMRVPLTGGTPQPVFPVSPGSVPLCTRSSSERCAVAEPSADGRQVTLTAFDPVKGRDSEILRLNLDPSVSFWAMDLSPDGKQIAAIRSPDGPIELFSSRGKATGSIRPQGLTRIQFIRWAANGRGLYITTGELGARVLWHVDLQGRARLLWKNRGGNWALGVPSPDGRYLAIENSDESQNMWIMENF